MSTNSGCMRIAPMRADTSFISQDGGNVATMREARQDQVSHPKVGILKAKPKGSTESFRCWKIVLMNGLNWMGFFSIPHLLVLSLSFVKMVYANYYCDVRTLHF